MKGLTGGQGRGASASKNPPGCAEEGAAGGCGARRRAGRGRGQSDGGPGARGARRHGGRRGSQPPLTRRSVPVVGEAEPARAPRRGDEQVGSAPALPARLPRLEGGDQDAAGSGRGSPRWVRGGAKGEAGPAGFCVGHGPAAEVAAGRLSGRIVSRPLEPGLQPPRCAPEGAAPPRDAEGPGADASEGLGTGGGAGGTSFAASGGAF